MSCSRRAVSVAPDSCGDLLDTEAAFLMQQERFALWRRQGFDGTQNGGTLLLRFGAHQWLINAARGQLIDGTFLPIEFV